MNTDLDPSKYHVISVQKLKKIVFFSLIGIAIIGPLVSYGYYKFAVTRPSQTDKEVTYRVEKGQSVADISNELYSAEAINSAFLLKLYIVINKLQDNIQAGNYIIPAGSSVAEVANLLQHGKDDVDITFTEGMRVEEYALAASKTFKNIGYENFIELAKSYEGTLFPETYRFNIEVKENEIIDQMRETYKQRTASILTQENILKTGLSEKEILILASIVEREASDPAERPVVAGILINRFKEGELIGADATTQYAIAAKRYGCDTNSPVVCPNKTQAEEVNWWPHDLTVDELKDQSPYNTRAIVGLPPAPICSPGLDAIEAVINYTQTDYNYYLNDSQGKTHYAKTLEEHNINVSKYLR